MSLKFRQLFKLYWPLIGFVAPSLIIGYGFVIPNSCIAGVNELTIGYATSVAGACLTYWIGLRVAVAAHTGSG